MLESLRLFSNSWLAKSLLTLIILCFVFIWILPTTKVNHARYALSSGQSTISRDAFIYRVNKALANASIALNKTKRIGVQEASKIGLLQTIMQQLNLSVLMNEEARLMGINLSDDSVAKALGNDEFFKTNNSFDKNHFKLFVRNLGVLQQEVINDYKKEAQSAQLIQAATAGQTLPKNFIETANKYQQQRIDVEYLTVTKSNLLPVKAPETAALQQWFQLHKSNFKTKEQRQIELVSLAKDDIAKTQSISPKEITDYYTKHLDKYTIAEQRDYDILTTETEAAAQTIIAQKPKDINLERAQAADPKHLTLQHKVNITKQDLQTSLRDQVFALSINTYSKVIKDNNKFHVIHLLKITPKHTRPLLDEKKAIEEALKNDKTQAALKDCRRKITEAISAGKSLDNISTEHKLTLQTFSIDEQGKVTAGQTAIKNNQQWGKLTRSIFHSAIDAKPTYFSLDSDNSIWYALKNITAAREKSFEEAQNELITAYEATNISNELDKRAKELKQELDNGASVAQLAEENNLTAQRITGVTRSGDRGIGDTKLPENVYSSILSYSVDSNFIQPGITPESRLIFKIAKIYQDKQARASISPSMVEQFNNGLKNDILFAMELSANKRHPINVNSGIVKQVLTNM